MSTYVWMRMLESASQRYDLGIRLLSFGHVEKVYDRVAKLARGPEVLDLGCGTGNVALRLAKNGFQVTGVDLSPQMLDIARQKAPADVALRWVHGSAVELIDHFQAASFDTITGVLLFSELSGAEQREALRQCFHLLRTDGQLIIADEVRAPTLIQRAAHNLVGLPLAVVTYILTQASTRPVEALREKVVDAQFAPLRWESNRLGDFTLLEAVKREVADVAAA